MIQSLKKRALHRAKIIAGQMKSLEKQIDEEAYCMDILVQSLAIQKSLASLSKLVLENHLRTHVTDAMSSGVENTQQKALEELLSLYELHNNRGRQ